ncbi:MAG: DUF6691 family protein [Hyphomicrobium sp.]
MRLFVNFIAGLIFGAGLILSGMADPAKVLNFLDFSGTWDPSLAFVMAGAIAITTSGYALVQRRAKPVLENQFQIPAKWPVDARLVLGSAMFGLGWGLGGFCPGPAITALPLAAPGTLVFVPAMGIGIAAAVHLLRRTPDTADG